MQFKPEDIPQNISPSRSEIIKDRKIINSSLERQQWKVNNSRKSSKRKRFSAEFNNSSSSKDEENVTPTKINNLNISYTPDTTFLEEIVSSNGGLTPDKSGGSFVIPVTDDESDSEDVKKSRSSEEVSINNLHEKSKKRKKNRKTECASGSFTNINLDFSENERSVDDQEDSIRNISDKAVNFSKNATDSVSRCNLKNFKENPSIHEISNSSSSNNLNEKPLKCKKTKKSQYNSGKSTNSKLSTYENNQHFEEQNEYTENDNYDDEYFSNSANDLNLDDDVFSVTNSNEFENLDIDAEADNSPLYENMKQLDHMKVLKKRLYVLPKNSQTYFFGAASVKVLYGAVEILGYILNDKSKSVEIYSPRGSSLLYMKTLENSNQTKLTIEIFTNLGVGTAEAEKAIQNIAEDSTLVLCDKELKLNINFFEKYGSQQIFPKQDSAGFRFSFLNDFSGYNALKFSDEWEHLYKSIVRSTRLFLCGGKSVGKSTLLRYLVNRLLMDYGEVCVVDLDPGQSEFTVPGCLSICTIKEPVFGPNYTHIIKPDRCIFTSNLNVAHDPEEYLLNIKALLSHHTSKNGPTLINYMGFVRGLGLPLAASVITLVNPTMVVQIESQSKNKNFTRPLSQSTVSSQAIFVKELAKKELKYELKTVNSVVDGRKGFSLQPRHIRELCVLAYLSSLLPKGVQYVTDPAVPIYKTDLKQLKLISNGTEVPPAVVNGNLVALCQSLANEKAFICKGWGIVRGINLSTTELFLLTPESGDVLEEVTSLVLGSVALPPSFYMCEEDVSGLVPYVSVGRLSSFSAIPKRSHTCPANRKRMKNQNRV